MSTRRFRCPPFLFVCLAFSRPPGLDKSQADTHALIELTHHSWRCVEAAVNLFQEYFHDMIAQLLHTFPKDHLTTEGTRCISADAPW